MNVLPANRASRWCEVLLRFVPLRHLKPALVALPADATDTVDSATDLPPMLRAGVETGCPIAAL
jgi:hypothetical protein